MTDTPNQLSSWLSAALTTPRRALVARKLSRGDSNYRESRSPREDRSRGAERRSTLSTIVLARCRACCRKGRGRNGGIQRGCSRVANRRFASLGVAALFTHPLI